MVKRSESLRGFINESDIEVKLLVMISLIYVSFTLNSITTTTTTTHLIIIIIITITITIFQKQKHELNPQFCKNNLTVYFSKLDQLRINPQIVRDLHLQLKVLFFLIYLEN
ncbi:hypothetical protein QVD17_22403 [Tagetes erecta]|uniref:Transmembrane protein n=1 Tax=Tagetes erecta TaxID=13708 RepID=A0AAD8KCY3_TARER|nr:hypothetical protein QVD17_22403 [Tagetes erecta]